jgi:hypothetical protein
MVALQCMVALGVLAGTSAPVCGSSDHCYQAGTFCAIGATDRCNFCGKNHPLPDQTDPATGGTLNDPDAPDFTGFNLTAVAELCADPSLAWMSPTISRTDGTAGADYATASSIVSWCKSRNDALDLLSPDIPGTIP